VVEILEQGAVSFLAVPRGAGAARGPGDLERLFVVLAPAGRRPLRRISVGRHRLPDPRRRQRFYAHVDRIAPAAGRLTEDVRARHGGLAGNLLGVGRYTLARHRGHVHLAYALARACARGELAAALGVAVAASFVLCVFRRSLPPTRRPRARAPLAPATPERLDVIGAEVALVSGARPGARLAAGGGGDRVGEALAGALLRRGPRPRVASFARAAQAGWIRELPVRGERGTRWRPGRSYSARKSAKARSRGR
jgi:hypothetical protein